MIPVIRFIFEDTNEFLILFNDAFHHMHSDNFIHWINEHISEIKNQKFFIVVADMNDDTPEAIMGCYDLLISPHKPPMPIQEEAFWYVYHNCDEEEAPVF